MGHALSGVAKRCSDRFNGAGDLWFLLPVCIFLSPARLGIDANLISQTAALDVEGVAEPAASLLLLQLLIGDGAGTSLQCDCASLVDDDLGFNSQILASVGESAERERDHSENHKALGDVSRFFHMQGLQMS